MKESKKGAIRQLCEHFFFGNSEHLKKLFDIMLSEREALWMIELPATPTELAQQCAQDPGEIAEGLHALYMRGLVLISEHTAQGPRYILDSDAGRLTDMVLFDPYYERYGDAFLDLWRDFYNEELVHVPRDPDALPFRVIPVGETIEDSRNVLPYEQVAQIVKGARRIALQRCPCRIRERRCDNPIEACMSLDRTADYVLHRGMGRELDKQEALELLSHFEELGLVHEVENGRKPSVICNCCPCCCVFLRAITVYGKDAVVSRSRYRAEIDQDRCSACGTCLTRCHFGAIRVEGGQYQVDHTRCYGCGLCASACPEGAIALLERLPPDHIPDSEASFMEGVDQVPQDRQPGVTS